MSGSIEQMDRLNFCVASLTRYYHEQPLGHATGFFYGGIINDTWVQFLVSNWRPLDMRAPLESGV